MSARLQQNLRRLQIDHPDVQRLAVAAVFDALPPLGSRDFAAAIQHMLAMGEVFFYQRW
jgi:hypothetical protein